MEAIVSFIKSIKYEWYSSNLDIRFSPRVTKFIANITVQYGILILDAVNILGLMIRLTGMKLNFSNNTFYKAQTDRIPC